MATKGIASTVGSMKSLAITAIVLAMFPFGALADTKDDEESYFHYSDQKKAEAEKTIPAVIQQYATSMGCAFGMNPNNIVPFARGSFVVLFSLDVGCSGGSRMQRPVLAVVEHSPYFTMYINPNYSSPNQTPQNLPQEVTSIYSRDGKIFYRAKRWSKDIIEGELFFEGGEWKLTQPLPLE